MGIWLVDVADGRETLREVDMLLRGGLKLLLLLAEGEAKGGCALGGVDGDCWPSLLRCTGRVLPAMLGLEL